MSQRKRWKDDQRLSRYGKVAAIISGRGVTEWMLHMLVYATLPSYGPSVDSLAFHSPGQSHDFVFTTFQRAVSRCMGAVSCARLICFSLSRSAVCCVRLICVSLSRSTICCDRLTCFSLSRSTVCCVRLIYFSRSRSTFCTEVSHKTGKVA